MYVGFRLVEVPALFPSPLPSPKFHDHTVPQLPTGMLVERSLNWKFVVCLKPLVGLTVKLAVGRKHGAGVGVGVGVGAGVSPGLGLGLGVGTGVGIGVGSGVGVAVAEATKSGGSVMICAEALEVSVTSLPPKNGAISGVISEKWPTTDTGAGFLGCIKGWFVNYVTAGPIVPGQDIVPGTVAIGIQLNK
jgi:hypothetical protein